MSLASKGSRAITVDGESYRWAVSPDSGYDVLVVQSADGVGCKLLTTVDYSRIEFASADGKGAVVIVPGLVTSIIRQARQHGWVPAEGGPDFVCRLNGDESIEVRGSD